MAHEVKIRIAENVDGKTIGELAWSCGFTVEGISWEDIYPYWLVAEISGSIVGAIQVLLGRPIGRIENLCYDRSLRKRDQAAVVSGLVYQALAVLTLHGAQFASGFIPERFTEYLRVLESRGGESTGTGTLVLKRLV